MTDNRNQHNRSTVGPMGAIATVPGEFISSAIFEAVQGACKLGAAVGRAASRLHRG